MISVKQAQGKILESKIKPGKTKVPIIDSLGFVLEEDIVSRDNIPVYDNSAMDGFAIRALDIKGAENNYPVMDLDDLTKFGEKVNKITYKDCILFMWITAPKLNWMNDVLESWGFEYKTNIIWDKIKPMMGHYSSVRHEILIIAGKGKSAPICDGKTIQSIDSVQSIDKTTVHSQKPEQFYEIIEKLYPNYKKIELFARNKKKGWDVWGNEI